MRARATTRLFVVRYLVVGCLVVPCLVVRCLVMIAEAHAQGMEIDGVRHGFRQCRAIGAADKRLACYDALQSSLEPPTFQGSHSQSTPFFTIERPTLLRYQSDGPIFVMYLQDTKGDVVQNLHIGGGGEATYLIAKPGTYNLDVNGTDTWRIWLEPQTAADNPAHG